MSTVKRKLPFVLAASDHGTMIVSRLDYHMVSKTSGFGVGFQILESGAFDSEEISLAVSVLDFRRRYFMDGVFACDCDSSHHRLSVGQNTAGASGSASAASASGFEGW